MQAARCDCCGGIDSATLPRAEGLCQRCHYYRRRLELGTRIDVILAAMIRRHPHDASRIRRLRHWMLQRDSAATPSARASSQ